MSALTVAEVLDRAADLIEPEGKWTQGAYARDELGNDLVGDDDCVEIPPAATCFCLYGAIAFTEGCSVDSSETTYWLGQNVSVSACGWNDAPERTQAEVVAKLREAAALAKATGK